MAKFVMKHIVEHFDFETMLDVGAGLGRDARIIKESGKLKEPPVLVDLVDPKDRKEYESEKLKDLGNWVTEDFMDCAETYPPYDLVSCSHCLEHQLNIHDFLKKLMRMTKDDGVLAIVVPPPNYQEGIVGGHTNIFTAELLLYRLLLAGLDCAKAHVIIYKWNIGVVLRKKEIELPFLLGGVGNRPELHAMREWLPPMDWSPAPLFEGKLKHHIKKNLRTG